jgi:peptide/nickel transport system substrate-binding protein
VGNSRRLLPLLAVTAALVAAPAQAQKAKDTLRVAFVDPIHTILAYDDPKAEMRVTTDAVFDTLICYDPKSREFMPLLATAWTQVDDRTLEFTLREDVTFHDGVAFGADDVVYTLNWLNDPNNKLRYDDLNWMDHAEKIDTHRLRVVAKQVTPIATVRLAISAHILPAKLHAGYETKADFGRKAPVGTGPYKAVSVDSGSGIVLARNPDYRIASKCKPAAAIGTIHILPLPDAQTRLAQLSVGGVDLSHAESSDEATLVLGIPTLTTTAASGINFHYMTMDSVNRSGNAALSNRKVRQALLQAIDRDLLVRTQVAGGSSVHVVDALCLKLQRGCGEPDVRPYKFDPVAAKQLLADAGYPNGFDVEITAIPASYGLGEAIAGELRKIGVHASVDKVTFAGYRAKQSAGKAQIIVGQWPSLGLPDVAPTMDFYFTGARDYWRDETIQNLAADAVATLDDKRRADDYRKIFDRVNEQAYILPISTRPDVFIHGKDLVVAPDSINVYGVVFQEMRWR